MSDVQFASPMSSRGPVRNGDPVQYGDEADLSVSFYKSPVTGKDHIRIAFPGDKHSTYDQPVRETEKIRFHRQWDDYQNQGERFAGQTRLEEVAWMNEATADQFRAINIFTVEQLAAVQEGNIQNLGMGARTWIAKAKAYVEERRKVETADQAAAQMAEMENRMAEMQAQLEALTKKKPDKG